MSDDRPFFSQSINWRGVIDVVLALGLAGTWIGCLGGLHWFFDLFDHFRLQGFVVCALALIIALVGKRRWLILFATASLLINAWPLWSVRGDSALVARAQPDWSLRVVTFNLFLHNDRHDEVLRYLREQNADVIVCLEVTAAWEVQLGSLIDAYPHQLIVPAIGAEGLALLSRLPLTNLREQDFANGVGYPSITADLDHQGKRLHLIAVHPMPPTNSFSHTAMITQSRAIARHATQLRDREIILTGDFNAAPWSRPIAELTEHSPLALRSSCASWWPTWSRDLPVMLPIDLTFCTPGLFIAERTIGPDLGSDHRAQEMVIRAVR